MLEKELTFVNQLLNQFSTRIVRDLAWVIVSPPLVSGHINHTVWWDHTNCLKEFDDCLPALINLDTNPQPLIETLARLKSPRLGLVFEALIAYWLEISPNYKLLSKNIQIIEDKKTFGEIDFIIQDLSSQKTIHLEVAVKFYLGTSPHENPFRWFGTNTTDQLGKKVQHLQNHQTQLSKKYPHHFEYKIDEQQCFIKGRLFYPSGHKVSPVGMGVTKNHLQGSWSYADVLQANTLLIPIEKNNWLAEFNHQDIEKSINKEIGSLDLTHLNRAQCFVVVEELNSKLIEKERLFYLPSDFIFPSDDL